MNNENEDRMRLASRSLPARHGDDAPVPQILMLKSDHEQAIAAKDAELAAALEKIKEQANQRYVDGKTLTEQCRRIGELEVARLANGKLRAEIEMWMNTARKYETELAEARAGLADRPTKWAYEQACRVLNEGKAEIARLQQQNAEQANEIERLTHLRDRLFEVLRNCLSVLDPSAITGRSRNA